MSPLFNDRFLADQAMNFAHRQLPYSGSPDAEIRGCAPVTLLAAISSHGGLQRAAAPPNLLIIHLIPTDDNVACRPVRQRPAWRSRADAHNERNARSGVGSDADGNRGATQ
jgi:hypothetical protein